MAVVEESGELPEDVADITRKSWTDYVGRKRYEYRHWAMCSHFMSEAAEQDERCLWKLQGCCEWTEYRQERDYEVVTKPCAIAYLTRSAVV